MSRNAALRQYLKYAGVFVVGILMGAFLMSRVEQRSIDGAVASVRSHFQSNEELRAARERCHKRVAAAVPHAWNYANLADWHELRDFDLPRGEERLFACAVLAGIIDDFGANSGMKLDAVIARAKLAVTLEDAGHAELAEAQWEVVRLGDGGHNFDRAFVKSLLASECERRPWENLDL